MLFLTALALTIAEPGRLAARPGPVTMAAKRGVDLALGRDATLYVPRSGNGPLPLLVVLPGTGGDGRQLVDLLRPAAETGAFALLGLSPTPHGNFETVDRFFDQREAGQRTAFADWPAPMFGHDVARLDTALAAAFQRVAVRRVGLFGVSHGGSFALSIGLANRALFPTIEALSPGLLLLPRNAGGGQAIFLSHGKRDTAQPYRRTACAMVPKLKSLGNDVRFLPRDGGHAPDEAQLHAALDHFLSGGKTGPTAPPPGC